MRYMSAKPAPIKQAAKAGIIAAVDITRADASADRPRSHMHGIRRCKAVFRRA
jgi:hypothetical protein